MKNIKKLPPKSLNSWKRLFPEFSFETFYLNKLKPMHIAKVKEFLFKVIHNICICGDLLYRWKLGETKKCLYCDFEKQTIKHLLWDCRQSNNLWLHISDKLGFDINYNIMILGKKDLVQNNTISVIMYLIYKKFIEDINQDASNMQNLHSFMKNELQYKIKLYNCEYRTSEKFVALKSILNIL